MAEGKSKTGVVKKRASKREKKDWIAAYIFIAPVTLGLLVFYIWPFIQNIWFSFNEVSKFNVATFCGLANYQKLFHDGEVLRTFGNTLKYVVVTVPVGLFLSILIAALLNSKIKGTSIYRTLYFLTTVVQVLFCSMAAYAFARIEFPFKNAIFVLVLSVLMVPGQIFLIPQYRIVQSLGLLDTIPALFLPNLFSAFGTFLLRQFFMSLPKELEEAALLDGCNRFQIFGRIMLPLTKAGIVSLVIFTAKFAWNDFMWPLIVNTSMDKMTLGPALSTLQGQYTTKYPMQMAGAVMAVIPIIVLFFIFQKQFIEGVAQSGIKG